MKRLSLSLFLGALPFALFSQEAPILVPDPNSNTLKRSLKQEASEAKDDDLEVFWYEDFSNGLDGMDENGAWTVDGPQGDLWFQTFPIDAENGYNPDAALDIEAYGDKIPNFFGSRDAVNSPTRDNGVMMMDTDRWNSTSTETNPNGELTENPVESYLISPSMDLTGHEYSEFRFFQYLRMCCSQFIVAVDMSIAGEPWEEFIPFMDFTVINGGADDYDIETRAVLYNHLIGEDDLTDVRFRFRWNGVQSHYFWMLDDIKVQALPANEMIAGETFYQDYHKYLEPFESGDITAAEYTSHFEYSSFPRDVYPTLDLAMVVSSLGYAPQTGVMLEAFITNPAGEETELLYSDPIQMEYEDVDTLEIPEVPLNDDFYSEPGEYTVTYRVIQDQEDGIPENNLGVSRTFELNQSSDNNFQYSLANCNNTYDGAYIQLPSNVIWSVPFIIPESVSSNFAFGFINVDFLFAEDFAETHPDQVVYFNIRRGHVFDEDPDLPETITTVLFDPENPLTYASGDLEYTIEEQDPWNPALDGEPYPYKVQMEIPEFHYFEPGVVYMAEIRIPEEASGVFLPVSANNEKYSAFVYDEDQWYYLGKNSFPFKLTFGEITINTENVIQENGISLSQNFPNPFSESTQIKFSLEESGPTQLEVVDANGKLVYMEDLGNLPADIENTIEFSAKGLAPGMYTYSIRTQNSQVSQKMVVE